MNTTRSIATGPAATLARALVLFLAFALPSSARVESLAAEAGLPEDTPEAKVLRHLAERQIGPGMVELPGRVLLPEVNALSCATPQATGTIQANHPYYNVFLNADGGDFTAGTGPSHSVTALAGSSQNVIYGGAGGNPGTSDVSWHFHVQNVTYMNPSGGRACVFDPPDTAMEPASIGIEQEWTVSPEPGIRATLRQEIVAFGTAEDNSGVRLTLSTTNDASSPQPVYVGVRWQIDYQNASDDGPLFATVTCDPPVAGAERSTEHELPASEIRDFYRIRNNTGSPIFSNVSSTTAILGIPDTSTPDRLIYGRWGAMSGSVWNYTTIEGAAGPDSDSAVLYYHGYLPVDADVINPGQTVRHTMVIFTSPDNVDCGSFVPSCASSISTLPVDQVICAGDTATLDAGGISLVDCAGSVEYEWTDGTSTWPDRSIDVNPADTTAYTIAVTCTTDPGCRVDHVVRIRVDRPPDFQPPLLLDPDECNNGIKLNWNPATAHGASGTIVYNIYRSEISCADALSRPPLVAGIRTVGHYDASTIDGVTYYYVVEAEDMTPGTACSPTGPGGGSVTQMCGSAVTDTTDTQTPAGVGAVLFASHVGDEIRLRWPALRPLLPGEHPHLLKASLDPRLPFRRVSIDGDMTPLHVETDTSTWLQFFDLRVANACERESPPDYPPFID